jgi:Cohesin domain/FlgD Ig-like domain
MMLSLSHRNRWTAWLTLVALMSTAAVARAADDISADATGLCLSNTSTCVTVPVKWNRTDTTPVRAYSVTIQLSSSLTLCGTTTSAGYLPGGSLPPATFVVTPLGGGAYTIDEATLGTPCGATGSATLFNLRVASTISDGSGTITVTSVKARDCSNQPVPVTIGAVATIPIDHTAPVALALTATQKKTGNSVSPAGTTDILVSWTGQEGGSSVAVYRKAFGGYPYYDDAGGAEPTAPASPAAAVSAGWQLTGVTGSGNADRVSGRDFWYYVAFVTDGCGNVSSVSNRTDGTLNYHLGDVHNGVANCTGDDIVGTSDISFLGAHYGATLGVSDPLGCLDVGPTTNLSVNARPTTDLHIDFEDLVLFAVNYGQVSAPQRALATVAAGADRVTLAAPHLPGIGETFAVPVSFDGTGRIQALSLKLSYDHSVVEFLGVDPGSMLGANAIALSPGNGGVDVAALGSGASLTGSGELARARFRVTGSGDPAIGVDRVIARDGANHDVTVEFTAAPGVAAPRASGIVRAFPEPARDGVTLEWALSRSGPATLAVYDLAGRRVRTLSDGEETAGLRSTRWAGDDDAGVKLAAGFYIVRLRTVDSVQSKTVRIVR